MSKFNFSNSRAAQAARAGKSSFTLLSIVSVAFTDWRIGPVVQILATTLIGREVSRKVIAEYNGEFSPSELKKAVKAGHARNKAMAPCVAERNTPCYLVDLVGNILSIQAPFPNSIFPHYEGLGEGKQIILSDTSDTDLLAAEAWAKILELDAKDPAPGDIIFSQHCVQGSQVATFKAAYQAQLS